MVIIIGNIRSLPLHLGLFAGYNKSQICEINKSPRYSNSSRMISTVYCHAIVDNGGYMVVVE